MCIQVAYHRQREKERNDSEHRVRQNPRQPSPEPEVSNKIGTSPSRTRFSTTLLQLQERELHERQKVRSLAPSLLQISQRDQCRAGVQCPFVHLNDQSLCLGRPDKQCLRKKQKPTEGLSCRVSGLCDSGKDLKSENTSLR